MSRQVIRHGIKFSISLIVIFVFSIIIVNANKLSKTGNNIYINPLFVQQSKSDAGYINISSISVELNNEQEGILKYIVQAGDSLYGIAKKFGTTVSHIKKVNNIKGPIRPNQSIIISQDDGLIYVMKSSMNIKVFVEKYHLNLEDIMALNGIADESEILYKDQELFLNISQEKSYEIGLFPKPKPKIYAPKKYKKPTIVKKFNTQKSTQTYKRPKSTKGWVFYKNIHNGFYAGHCTRYMAATTPQIFTCQNEACTVQKRPFKGNAKDWYKNASAAGYSVGKTARAGAIVVYHRSTGPYAAYGHVAKVINVNQKNRTMLIEEMNIKGKFIVSRQTESLDNSRITGYIYP